MANDTLEQNDSPEKALHKIMLDIDRLIISLKGALNEVSKLMLKCGIDRENIITINEIAEQFSRAQLQLHYYDEIIHDRSLQQKNKPLLIRRESEK